MATGAEERRSQQRIRFEAPAAVRTGQHAIAASTKDVSDGGLFFFTDVRFEIGIEIDMIVMLPDEAGLPVSGMVCCHGHVVRSSPAGGQYGVAIEIDRFAPVQQV